MSHHNLHLQDFANDAARYILERGKAAIAERGLFRLSLAGGNTPRAVYAAMAKLGADFPWDKVQITFSDERCVPPDDNDSNFGMALLGQILVVQGALTPAMLEAMLHAQTIAREQGHPSDPAGASTSSSA